MSKYGVEVKGLREAQAIAEQMARNIHGSAIVEAVKDSAMAVERDAKRGTPVDTGRLRASITPEIRTEGNDVIGVVGSNVIYAPFVELGTRPHWPPIAALEVWARRHGTSAFLVARAIARKGTKAYKYLESAIEKNKPYIIERMKQAIAKTIKQGM